MPIYKNSKGKLFQTGIGGTYPVNDNDPQNYVEGFDEDEYKDIDFDEAVDNGY